MQQGKESNKEPSQKDSRDLLSALLRDLNLTKEPVEYNRRQQILAGNASAVDGPGRSVQRNCMRNTPTLSLAAF